MTCSENCCGTMRSNWWSITSLSQGTEISCFKVQPNQRWPGPKFHLQKRFDSDCLQACLCIYSDHIQDFPATQQPIRRCSHCATRCAETLGTGKQPPCSEQTIAPSQERKALEESWIYGSPGKGESHWREISNFSCCIWSSLNWNPRVAQWVFQLEVPYVCCGGNGHVSRQKHSCWWLQKG